MVASPSTGGASIFAPGQFVGGQPIGGPESLFNISGAPIAVLGGVFSGGLPLGGPVTQIFRGGSAPITPGTFVATVAPSGPIGVFFIGTGDAPIGVATFGGGSLPIAAPPEVARAEAILQPRTALVATIGDVPAPAAFIGGGTFGLGIGGAAIGPPGF